jgi:hypothetical protein
MVIKFTKEEPTEFVNTAHPKQRFRVDYHETITTKVWYIVRTDLRAEKPVGHIWADKLTLWAFKYTDMEPIEAFSVVGGYYSITD